jgi:hypothetical protein
MGQITYLSFQNWGISTLTSFDGTGLTGLTYLDLASNQLTSFDGTGLTGLTGLSLAGNPLISFYGGDMTQIGSLNFPGDWSLNTLETFDGGNMTALTQLILNYNQLTSFDGTGLSSLGFLSLVENQLTPQVNNSILNQLALNGLENGEFYTSGGRTAAGTASYDTLISRNWYIEGADLVPIVGGKLRVKGVGQINP